jgi:tetratricopeptide (TPR) repeat protein
MTSQTNQQKVQVREKLIVYMQDDERKTISESQAVSMLEGIAEDDLPRALGYYLSLTNENPHAEILLERFYQTLLDMFMFAELFDVTNLRLKRLPNCKHSLNWKVVALQQMRRNDEAIELLEAITTSDPNNLLAWNSLGRLHNIDNQNTFQNKDLDANKLRTNRAARCFDKAILLKPSFAIAHWNRSKLSQDPTTDLASIKNIISNNSVPENEAHTLHFSAYRLCEKLSQHEEAFEHLLIANAMKRRTLKYDLSAELADDESTKAIFSPEFLQHNNAGYQSTFRPIFIMGLPGSGTALVEKMVSSHSEVAQGGDQTVLASTVARAQKQSNFNGSINQWLTSRTSQNWKQIGQLYEHNARFVRGDKNVLTDRHAFNLRSIGLIAASLPNAKIIVVDREPMDVAFECYRQLFDHQASNFSYQFDELAHAYASYINLIDYWESHTDGLILQVRYEELIHKPQAISEGIMQFCDLELQESSFEIEQFEQADKSVCMSMSDQSNIGAWKQYEAQMQPMSRELKKLGLI